MWKYNISNTIFDIILNKNIDWNQLFKGINVLCNYLIM